MEREFISSFESQWDGADIIKFEVLRYKNGEELETENMNKGLYLRRSLKVDKWETKLDTYQMHKGNKKR